MNSGDKIVVFDAQKNELGEGTFRQRTVHPDLGLIAYECDEHVILAKLPHFVRTGGQTITVRELPQS